MTQGRCFEHWFYGKALIAFCELCSPHTFCCWWDLGILVVQEKEREVFYR